MKSVKLLIKILFIISAFLIIYNKIDFSKLNLKINYFWLFVAFFLFNLSQFVSTIRIENYLQKIQINYGLKKQLVLYYVGMFYNLFIPGGIGGDGYKAYKFEKEFKVGYKKIIKALLIDRISGLFTILFLIGIITFFSSFNAFFVYVMFLFLSPFFLYFVHKYFFIEFKEVHLKNFFYSLIIQTLQALAFLAILISLRVKTHLIDFILLFFISSIVSVVPLSVGGVGLRELTFLYGLEFLGLDPSIGVVAAFLFFLVSAVSSLIGGILILKSTMKN